MSTSEMLHRQEVCEILGISLPTLDRARKAGKFLEEVKYSKRPLWPKEKVLRFKEEGIACLEEETR